MGQIEDPRGIDRITSSAIFGIVGPPEASPHSFCQLDCLRKLRGFEVADGRGTIENKVLRIMIECGDGYGISR